MKRLIIAVCMFLIVLGLSIASHIITSNAARNMIDLLERAAAEPTAQTEQTAEKLVQKWEGYQKILMAYSDHQDIEKITEAISILPANIQRGRYDSFVIECRNAQNALKHFEQSEKIRWENVL